jgi:hypothetical protein
MNTDNRPNAISWKKKPRRHIGTRLLQSCIKTFGRPKNYWCCKWLKMFHKSLIERWPTSYSAGESIFKWQNSR